MTKILQHTRTVHEEHTRQTRFQRCTGWSSASPSSTSVFSLLPATGASRGSQAGAAHEDVSEPLGEGLSAPGDAAGYSNAACWASLPPVTVHQSHTAALECARVANGHDAGREVRVAALVGPRRARLRALCLSNGALLRLGPP